MEDVRKIGYPEPRRPRIRLVRDEDILETKPKPRSWFRLRKTYDHLTWKEELYLCGAVLAIALGSIALSVWIVEGGFTLESRLRSGRITVGEREKMYKEQYEHRRYGW